MIDWTDFHFLRPLWFLTLLPLAVLVWRISKKAYSQTGWADLIDAALRPHVLIEANTKLSDSHYAARRRENRVQLWVSIGGLLAVFALAGPVFERLPQPVFRSESALVIALDLSRSMDAEDLKPSRLIRARYKVADLLNKRKDGQTALLVYAGSAFVVTPLTDDVKTIRSQLGALSTDLMPAQGSRADRALLKASDLLKQAGAKKGAVLLITDGIREGEESQKTLKAARELVDKQYQLFIMGLGTKEGAPIRLPQGDYLTDSSGDIVIPVLEENILESISQQVNGIYQPYTSGDEDIDRLSLLLEIADTDREGQATELDVEKWREDGPWLLLLMIPLAALAFRKGNMFFMLAGTGIILTGITNTGNVLAVELWQRPDQQANELLQAGKPEEAAKVFVDPRWKGSVRYRTGDYAGALESWSAVPPSTDPQIQARDFYNTGNAQAKLGEYSAALDSYKKALQNVPEFEDAQYNYDLVKKALEKQQKEQGGDEGQDDQSKSDNKGSKDKDSKKSDQQESENQKSGSGQKEDQQEKQKNDQQGAGQQNDQQQQDTRKDQKAQEKKSSENRTEQSDRQNARKNQTARAEDLSVEAQQAMEQWLRRIPDDPGGLLRRKFIYQYQRQQGASQNEEAGDQQW